MAKILVIDDDELVRNMVSSALKKAGHDVALADNGSEGVTNAQNDPPDLVITDMLMPDKEGIQTILELQAAHQNIKIIAISGGGATKNMNFLHMAEKVGAQKVLAKPFKPSVLLSTVNDLLAG